MRAPAAVMVNLLGSDSQPLEIAHALEEPCTFLHVYGKTDNRPGRKMGHITAIGETLEGARAHARRAASSVRV
jgi:5-(carboxyamino)imidazole ribonucleotide synthase